MKFGVFLPNGSNGYVLSEAIEPYVPTYDHLKSITLEAERQGLSFALPMIKFKGFGGATGFWDHPGSPYLTLLEPYSVPLLRKKGSNINLGQR